MLFWIAFFLQFRGSGTKHLWYCCKGSYNCCGKSACVICCLKFRGMLVGNSYHLYLYSPHWAIAVFSPYVWSPQHEHIPIILFNALGNNIQRVHTALNNTATAFDTAAAVLHMHTEAEDGDATRTPRRVDDGRECVWIGGWWVDECKRLVRRRVSVHSGTGTAVFLYISRMHACTAHTENKFFCA